LQEVKLLVRNQPFVKTFRANGEHLNSLYVGQRGMLDVLSHADQ
jgi:hypothetical protein